MCSMDRCSLTGLYFVLCLSLFISISQSASTTNSTSATLPLLLVISFDGFRWDYPDLYKLSHLESIVDRGGLRVKYIENSFATVTFPSHYTMVTGLFEETHGIVANTMYDPTLHAIATVSTMNDTKWW
jgi:predicted AlkP superfamily pyrophosphatase or phosphodiesterase